LEVNEEEEDLTDALTSTGIPTNVTMHPAPITRSEFTRGGPGSTWTKGQFIT